MMTLAYRRRLLVRRALLCRRLEALDADAGAPPVPDPELDGIERARAAGRAQLRDRTRLELERLERMLGDLSPAATTATATFGGGTHRGS